jgi:bacterial/archaeal transporter family protein
MGYQRIPKWLIHALLAIFWWGLFGFLAKLGSDKASPVQTQILFTLGMVPLVITALIRLRFKVGSDGRGTAYGILIGVLSTMAFLAYLAAMARGKASLVGPVTALFPLVTIPLAFIVLKEKLNRVQLLGVVFALVSIVIFSL